MTGEGRGDKNESDTRETPPVCHELLEKFASALIELGKSEEALLPLEKLARDGSASKEALYSRGITLLEIGRQEEAFEVFSRAP